MNFAFVSNILNSTWQAEPFFFLQNLPLREMFLKGIELEYKKPNTFHVFAPKSGLASLEVYKAANSLQTSGVILVTTIQGVLTQYDAPCGDYGTETIAQILKKYDKNDDVQGHLIIIDSGGGQSSSVKPLANLLPTLSKKTKVLIKNMAASAAYGIISGADEIFAEDENAIVGSIGTMISFDGYKANHTDPDGLQHIRLYASKSTRKNEEFEKALNEANFKPLIDDLLNPINESFIALVQSNRPQLTAEHLNGSTLRASQAIGTYIDGIKSLEEVLASFDLKANSSQNNNKSNNSYTNNMKIKSLMIVAMGAGIETVPETTKEGLFLNAEQVDRLAISLESKKEDTSKVNQLTAELEASRSQNETLTAENATLKQAAGANFTANTKKTEGSANADKTVFNSEKSFIENLTNEDFKKEYGF